MATLFSPIILAVKQDFKHIDYDLRAIMAPITIAWALLLLVVLLNYKVVMNYKKHLKEIANTENF